MNNRLLFTAIAFLAVLAGTALRIAGRSAPEPAAGMRVAVSPAAIYAASFADLDGNPQSLGRYQGRTLILNFWATWCVPCREEMPGFARLQERWARANVQFVGLTDDDPGKVSRFARDLSISYPLWIGGANVADLSRRLGNRLGVLPYTVILGADGDVLEARVGQYPEEILNEKLSLISAKTK